MENSWKRRREGRIIWNGSNKKRMGAVRKEKELSGMGSVGKDSE